MEAQLKALGSLIIELIRMSQLNKPCYYSALLYWNIVKEKSASTKGLQMNEISFSVWEITKNTHTAL